MELWLQGLYIYEAIGDMVPVLRPFAKSGTRPAEYPSEPYAISAEEREERRKRDEEAKAEELSVRLKAWAKEINKKFKQEEVENHAERADGADRHRDNRECGGSDEKPVVSEPSLDAPEKAVG